MKRTDEDFTAARLDVEVQPDLGKAWRRFSDAVDTRAKPARLSPGRPLVIAMVAGLAVLGIAAAPPVRSVAADILQLFRAEKFAAVKIDPTAMIDFDPSRLGEFEMKPPSPIEVGSIEEAARATGLTVLTPAGVPAYLEAPNIHATGKGELSLKFNLKKFNAYLAEKQIESVELPSSLDGKTLVAHVPPGVIMEYGSELLFAQGGLPTVEAPSGVDIDALRAELLKLPFFPPEVREQLAAMTDWKRTLPIPYPSDDATPEKVVVSGREGLYFLDKGGAEVLIWNDGSQAYGLMAPEGGQLAKTDLLNIAESLR